jgi:hypothetical protein
VYTKINAVPDQHAKVQADAVYVGEFNRLLGAQVCAGASAVGARLVSPSIRKINPYNISPLELGLTPADNPRHAVNPNNGFMLDANEGLELEINANPAAAEQITGVAFLAPGGIQRTEGQIVPINCTITLALVAGAWAFSELLFDDELPIGRYDVVGARAQIATAVAFRFVPVGGSHRPGAPVHQDEDDGLADIFRFGQMGTWFGFDQLQPPGVEVLSSAAAGSATYNVIMDVIRR